MVIKKIFNQKGLTLLEMIIVLALIGIIITIPLTMLYFGNATFAKGSDQYDIQDQVRNVASFIVEEVRFSTELEVISAQEAIDGINDAKTGGNDYKYIYLQDGKMVHYSPVEDKEYTIQGNLTDSSGFASNDVFLEFSIKGQSGEQDYQIENDVKMINLDMAEKTVEGVQGAGLRYSHDRSLLGPVSGGANNEEVEDEGEDEDEGEEGEEGEEEDELEEPVIVDGPYGGETSLEMTFDQTISSATLIGASNTVSIDDDEVTFSISENWKGNTSVIVEVTGAGGTSTFNYSYHHKHGWSF